MGGPVALTEGLVSQLKVPDASMPFEAWLARVDRVEY